jgi:signal transduction histidine kinase/CheY-like chemotaxis protein
MIPSWEVVIDALDDALLVEGGDGRVVHCNLAWIAWFGLDGTPEAFRGWPVADLERGVAATWAPDAQPRRTDAIRAAGASVRDEPIPLADGRVLARDATPLGTEQGWIWRYRDLTAPVRAEAEQRRALAEAEAANTAKSDFLAQISHEIRTPMNAILGYADILLRSTTDRAHRSHLHAVQRNGEALLRLVSDSLDISKIEAGQIDLAEEAFDPVALCEEVAHALALRAEERGLRLIVDLADDLPETVRGDSSRVRQIATNFLTNALRYTPFGEVVLSIAWPAGPRGRTLAISVSDTGPGLDADELTHLFEPYFRGQAGRAHGGTGLGLAICRALAQRMGGEITVESTQGRGARFTLHLPVAASAPPRRSAPRLSGVRVAVVDGSAAAREALCRRIRQAGGVADAFDTLDALLPLTDLAPDVLAIDQDALQPVLDAVLARPAWRDVRVVCLTLLDPPPMAEHIDRCAPRPFSSRGLVAMTPQLDDDTGRSVRVAASDAPILIVEDDLDNRVAARAILEDAGYEVVEVGGGADAIALAATQRWALILMDIAMPEVDGIQATHAIRAAERKARRVPVPILAWTAHALDSVRRQCQLAGMDGFLTKPVPPKALLAALTRQIRRDGPCVLVVDDDMDARRVFALRLRAIAPEVRILEAATADATLARLREQAIDLGVFDVDLGGADGLALLTEARAAGVAPRTAVALTGHAPEVIRARARRAGVDLVLQKPLESLDLEALVRLMAPGATVEDEPDIQDLVDAWRTQKRALLPDVLEALEAGELASVRHAAHQLKGTAATYGFPEVGRLARTLEEALERRDTDAAARCIAAMRSALDRP